MSHRGLRKHSRCEDPEDPAVLCPAGSGAEPWASALDADGISKPRDHSIPEQGAHICPQGPEQPQHPRLTRPGAPTASSFLHFPSRAELQPRSSSPDLRTGVIFRRRGGQEELGPSGRKAALRRAGRSRRVGTRSPPCLQPPRLLPLSPAERAAPGKALPGAGHGRAEPGVRGRRAASRASRALSRETPARGMSRRGHSSHGNCPRPPLLGGRGSAWGGAGGDRWGS